MIGLGCMRLSTAPDRDRGRAFAVIHAALDAGVTLLDTADVYAHDETEIGHNERLIADALAQRPDGGRGIEVATKGGLRRVGKNWVPDGRATWLRAACEASRKALAVETIDLYQLHAVDPKTPIETSVRALAALQQAGHIRRIGLCNVNVSQIEAARRIARIACVQVSLGIFDDENLRNGVAEYCRDHGIRLLAWRPFGGTAAARIARTPPLPDIAARLGVSPWQVALAWLRSLAPDLLMPLPGPTRVESARELAAVSDIRLAPDDIEQLERAFPAARRLRVPREKRTPKDAHGDVVVIMGMPGAGKTTLARQLEQQGYQRLNRDERGGSLRALAQQLEQELGAGHRHFVLDNTYATRAARSHVVDAAWQHGVPVRCIHVDTPLPVAQVNAILRLLRAHGWLPGPEELRERGRTDHRYFGPDAQFRWQRQLEPPDPAEGFRAIEVRTNTPVSETGDGRPAVFLDYDRVLFTEAARDTTQRELRRDCRVVLARFVDAGWLLFATAWRPQIADGSLTVTDLEADFAATRAALDLPIEFDACTHAAGPPTCWCRKPLPGLILQFACRHGIDLRRSLLVADSAADRTLATRLGLALEPPETFLARTTVD